MPVPRVIEMARLGFAPAAALALGSVSLLSSAAQLPVPCAAAACGVTGPATWVTSGSAQLVQAGNILTINQSSAKVILNWQSFNISSDGTVTFKQPDAASVALNQIFQADPSKILGALNANGSIYLINQNGIVFGNGAQVNTGSLIASSLNITPAALSGILNAAQQQKPAFASFVDANGQPLPSGPVQVAAGATIKAPNGEILLLAPEVTNQGSLQANGGQVILAAGDSVYLAPSTDPNLRGLLVEVGHGGKVTNAAASTAGGADFGQITANQGDVTLVGLMVNQSGRISATTSVRQNGSIHLLAQDGGFVTPPTVQGGAPTLGASNSGTLTLGAESHSDVLLDLADTGTAVDATAQPKSQVVLSGEQVELKSGSEITATSGNVSISASAIPAQSPQTYSTQTGPGRLVIDPNASIDVSGANIELPMESNVIAVQLRGTELADSPLQRNGPLRGTTVDIDIRQSGVLGGVAWQGSPIGNLSGYVATIAKDVGQRNLTGGSITLNSDGGVIVAPQATLNISGGSTTFLPGFIKTTKVLGTNGHVYDISQADPNQTYTGIVSGFTVSNSKWGTTQTFPTYSADPRGTFEAGYIQGNDAGQLSIAAPHVVLDSKVDANTVVGPFQRQMPGNFDPTAALYRPINQMPLGGTLILGVPGGGQLGNNYVLPDVTFASGSVLDTLTGQSGGPFDPLTDPLPAALDMVRLRPELFGANGIAQLQLFANGTVTVPQNTALQMPVAGKLSITAGVIDFLGSIKAPDGSVSLVSTPTQTLLLGAPSPAPVSGLTLGANSVIDVSGEWVNDLPARAQASGTAPLAIAGGSVTLSGAGGAFLDLEPGSLIDASGGAQRTAAGQIVGGSAGNIAISVAATPNAIPVPITLGSTLQDYALQHGGLLSIAANEICVAATNCASGTTDLLWVAPQIFSADGFGSIALTADLYGLAVLPGTQIAPRQVDFMLSSNAFGAPTGTPMESIASLGLLPDVARAPVNVVLNKKTLAPSNFTFDHTTYDSAGILSIGHDASIVLDARGSLTLTSDTSINIDGKLSAPAGSISVSTTNSLPLGEFIPSQGIWLLDGAQLSTQGTSLLQVDNVGRTTGTVLAGGNIAITANRGYLITDPLSSLDASGTAAKVNISQDVAVGGIVSNSKTLVGSNGGTVSLTAAEGMLLNGSVTAFAGNAPGTVGGALNVTIDGNLHGPESGSSAIFPFNPRNIIVSNGSPVIGAPQYAIPDQYSGEALVPGALLQGGGFSAVTLSAKTLFDADNTNGPVSGSIIFPQNTSLQLPASIRLDAPLLVSEAGAQIQLSAPYVGLGYDDVAPGAQVGATSSSGMGTLQVQASLVDFFGSLGLGGISNSKFTSAGDIRFIGVQSSDQTTITGTLQAQGSLTFQANQLYPTTLSQFTVVDEGASVNTIAVLPGAGGAPVLSAGGSLTLQADTIQQGGVLRAPFGQIVLQADDMTLEAGSVTSTSGVGQLIPFGLTQAGADWVYALPGGQFKVYTQSGPPAKSIQLRGNSSGNSIIVDQGATVDLSGGGDLQASEFVPGVGGTIDVLSNAVNPNQFAIVPIPSGSFAPYDTQSQVGFAYSTVTRVTLDGGGGVPAGEYAVLPAAYALLPGAFLVKPVAGFANITPGQVFAQTDGGAVIAGQFTLAGSTTASPLTQGFNVRPGTAVQNLAQYNLTSADTFFTDLANAAAPAGAGSSAAATPRLPVDAGQLQFLAGQQLQFLGSLAVAPASGGRGAEVDISASQIEITNGSGSAATGTVALNAAQLNSLGAASLLLGGTRSEAGGIANLTTTATTLTVDAGVTLSGSEILLTTQDQLSIGAGAKLSAGGGVVPAPTEYDLSGGGALLRVSTGALAPVSRGQLDGASGNLTIAQGATIQATGSATLEASGQMLSQATYDLSGGALSFTAPRIALSTDGSSGVGGTSSLQLSTTQLSSLNLSALDLVSGSTIDVFGNSSLIAPGSVTLNTGILDAMTSDAALLVTAGKITLQGAAAAPMAGSTSTSSGTLALQADQLLLKGGNMSLLGFSSDTLAGAADIRANGSGSILADQSLTLNTAQLSSAPGASFQFSGANSLDLLGALASSNSIARAPGAGGAITLTGASVTVDTAVNLPSGVFRALAQGPSASDGVMLGALAAINVAGFAEIFDTLQVVGPGGRVDLSSAAGGIAMAAGSKIDLSAGGPGGAAGQLSLSVPNGQIDLRGVLLANGGSGATAGQFSVDATMLPDLAILNANLNAGGFGGSRNFVQRGAGDLVVSASADINAAAVMISNDGGSVDVQGRVNASGISGGTVSLAARNAVDIEGSILASASGVGESGGNLSITSNSGAVRIGSGAMIDLSGAAGASGGTLSLSVPRAALTNLAGGSSPSTVSLGGTIQGVQQVRAEGVAIYSVAGNTISAGDVIADPSNPIYADASNFTQNAAEIATALKGSSNLNVSVLPGIEIDSTGDLTLGSACDLSAWRFNGAPGILTLRAAGNLLVQQSLSDGFSGVNGPSAFVLPVVADQSWSYRLVAGADLTASNALSVQAPGASATGSGNLEIAPGVIDNGTRRAPDPVMIRTGTGDIDIAAAGDLQFGNRASVIYTAGQNSNAGIALSQLANLAYPTAGGNIRVNVGGDILGAPTNQLVTSWLWRSGQAAGVNSAAAATGWTDNYQWFEQNIGALAGGNVNIKAGGNISELSVAIPSIGVQTGGTGIAQNVVQVTGGGNLTVESGGDITGGSYFVGRGSGKLESWGSVGANSSVSGTGFAPVLALGDASLDVTARTGISLEGIVNPFLLPQATVQPTAARTLSTFSTYSDASAVNLVSNAGDITFLNQPQLGLEQELNSMPGSVLESAFHAYPGTVNAAALSGNLNFQGNSVFALWPSPSGNLNLLAAESVVFSPGAGLIVSGLDPNTSPNPDAPVNTLRLVSFLNQQLLTAPAPGTAYTPIHSAAFPGNTADDPNPIRIVAAAGDISNASLFYVPKPIHLVAGDDITGLTLRATNLSSTDLSVVSAGRDLVYAFPRDPTSGILQVATSGILIEGPGSLLIEAGRNVNLGTAGGVTTVGNLYNPSIPSGGADVSVLTGATVASVDLSAFVTQYLVNSDNYDSLLVTFLQGRTDQPLNTKAQALSAFASLPLDQQYELSQQILFNEIRTGGRAAAAAGPTHGDYTRSFTALETLFPKSTTSDAPTTYPGSLSLYFSQIYTLDGGSISMITPGGSVNVGLSTPPASFGVSKAPSQLGIVAQSVGDINSVSSGDFLVNQSRVFAANGGDILVWSTDGNIDAGRGAKTAISAPPPTITFTAQGQIQTTFPAALVGSGIQALATSAGVMPGDVDLYAPRGVVNASDAGIVAGNLTIGATAVLGRDNITVSGISVGVPVDASGLGANLASSSSVGSSATSAAALAVESGTKGEAATPLGQGALAFLDVFVLGLGEEVCKQDDLDCLKRQKTK